jgi:aerobic carbon-monoxide dehydrogenase large subunit
MPADLHTKLSQLGYEHLAYSPDGQPLATTFMDYIVPSATEIPPISVDHFESPSPRTAFGAKGAGEAGLIGPALAIAAAIEDALAEFDLSWLTILGSGLARRCDLHVPGSWELDLHTNPGS